MQLQYGDVLLNAVLGRRVQILQLTRYKGQEVLILQDLSGADRTYPELSIIALQDAHRFLAEGLYQLQPQIDSRSDRVVFPIARTRDELPEENTYE